MTAKENQTWSAVISQEEALARQLHPEACPQPSIGGAASSASLSYGSSCNEYDVDGLDDVTAVEKLVKEEVMSVDFIQKRPAQSAMEQILSHGLFTCENRQCPHHDPRLGFPDKNSRNNHQFGCQFQSNFSQRFHPREDKPQSNFPLKPAQFLDISSLGIPPEGQKTINELMSFYDNNVNTARQAAGGEQQSIQMDEFFKQALSMGAEAVLGDSPRALPQGSSFLQEEISFQTGFQSQHGASHGDVRFNSLSFPNWHF